MITLFTTPKPFHSHIATIQQNAIRSWTLLDPPCEIILFGKEEGTQEAAEAHGIRYCPEVSCSEYGTPFIKGLFEQAQQLASHSQLCYVNADIILMSDFVRAVERVKSRKGRFLMVGQRWDIDIDDNLDFSLDWETRLQQKVVEDGKLHPRTGIDYFVFQHGIWGKIPPLTVGRPGWDNWAIRQIRARRYPVVDATAVVLAVHQNHERSSAWTGPEARINQVLAKGRIFSVADATWRLLPRCLIPAMTRRHLLRRWKVLPILYPEFRGIHSFAHSVATKIKSFVKKPG